MGKYINKNIKRILKRMAACFTAFAVMAVSVSCRNASNDKSISDNKGINEGDMQLAKTTPYGRYPETITYTLAKMTGTNNSNMPEGDTYENNAYTRYLYEKLNIQNENVLEEYDTQYYSTVSMLIASKKLPDIFIVSDYEELKFLAENDMIEDLTECYQNCASEKIKDIYASYGAVILDNVTFDGKLMAIPKTNIANGPNLLWLRKDWLDKLGLDEPETLDDVVKIIGEFISKDPGGNGEGETIGLVCDNALSGECGYSSEYLFDIVFANYAAYPKQWIENESGEVVYGSVQENAKEALAKIREMYENGILDKNFLLRTSTNIIELIKEGKCGAFFGPWWAPNNPLMEARESDETAEWKPYLISTDADGSTSYYSQNPSYKYVVVRKGYEHPEIAVKIISVLFDLARSEEAENMEFKLYYQMNVDPTARPIAINVDYYDALFQCYERITDVLEGKETPDTLPLLEASYYESAVNYINNADEASVYEWAAYASRIQACSLLVNSKLNVVTSLYFGQTDTMAGEWWKLSELEHEAYIKIITGEEPLDYFDTFVEMWYEMGGETITKEVRNELKR